MLKVSYIDYLKVKKACPTFIEMRKIIPGDIVIIPVELEKKAREILELPEEVVEELPPAEVCPKCLKIKQRCVCAKLEAKAARERVAKEIIENKQTKKSKINEDGQVVGKEASVDSLTKSIVKLRVKLKAEGKNPAEIKEAVAALKEKGE